MSLGRDSLVDVVDVGAYRECVNQYDLVSGFQARLDEIGRDDKELFEDLERWGVDNGLVDAGDVAFQLGVRAADALMAPVIWRRAVGEMYNTGQVMANAGDISRQAIAKWRDQRQLLALPGVRTMWFPTWQFEPTTGRPRPVVGRVLQAWLDAEPEVAPHTIATWARTPTELIAGGAAPVALLGVNDDEFEQIARITIAERTR